MTKTRLLSSLLLVLGLTACSGGDSWKVAGNIEGAQGKTVVLESFARGRWSAVDSAKLGSDGAFSIKHLSPGYPDIYRLTLDGRSIYFPVDSTESVKITANAAAFDSSYSLEGSESAAALMHVDERVRKAVEQSGAGAASDSLLKRELAGMMLGDPSGIVAYYIINKRIDGTPIFNPADRGDNRIIGAVANAFVENRPDDPRTQWLKQTYLSNRVAANGVTVEAPQVGLLEIDLMDETGKSHKLSEVAAANKVVVLSFTNYTSELSPAYNLELNKVYDRYRASGLQIYQVAFDADEYQWKKSARNLPWITVYNSSADGAVHLDNYNVVSVPTTFIISGGDIAERVTDPTQVASAVAKRF